MDSKLLDSKGRAYGLEPPPGTPGGDLLRRYWQPVALASEATELPKLIRRFGEDLILFRNRNGEPGLLYPRCWHRGASLQYGGVEDGGIRCCYHGWKFSSQGELSPFPLDHNWFQVYENASDHYHVPILHSLISGNQFLDPRLTSRIPEIWWEYSKAGDSILTYSKRDAWMRIEPRDRRIQIEARSWME